MVEVLVITKQEAIRLSLIKWEYIVKYDGTDEGLLFAHPELKNLPSNCGLCDYARDVVILSSIKDEANLNHRDKCKFCDLAKLDTSCYDTDSYFQIWANHKTKDNAVNVLNLIKQIKF